MTESKKPWSPSVASLLANVIDQTTSVAGELEVHGLGVECFVGAEPGGETWLRLVCEPSTVIADNTTAAVRFQTQPEGYRIIVVNTIERTLTESFFKEVTDLLASGTTPGGAGYAALERWRRLLARPPGRRLGENQLVGLFGELEVLEEILRRGGGLESWTGWMADHDDFRLPGLVIEVKSTISSDFRRVRIHGLSQLDDPQDASDLVLMLRRLERSPEGRSIPDLVDDLIDAGASRPVLLEHLLEVGYSEQHRSHYETFRFVSSEVVLRKIDANHPRLVRADFEASKDLARIDRIEYDLDLNGDDAADLTRSLGELLDDTISPVR